MRKELLPQICADDRRFQTDRMPSSPAAGRARKSVSCLAPVYSSIICGHLRKSVDNPLLRALSSVVKFPSPSAPPRLRVKNLFSVVSALLFLLCAALPNALADTPPANQYSFTGKTWYAVPNSIYYNSETSCTIAGTVYAFTAVDFTTTVAGCTGVLSADGTQINWDNGSVWTGPSVLVGPPVSSRHSFAGETWFNGLIPVYFTSETSCTTNEIAYQFAAAKVTTIFNGMLGALSVDGTQIAWSNGEVWTRCNYRFTDAGTSIVINGCMTPPTGALVIPATILGKPVTRISGRAFYNCTGLTDVTIPSSVTCINAEAFMGCVNLTNVNLSSALTSIGDRAFSGCSALGNIIVPLGVSSIGNGAFSNCSSLANTTFLGNAPLLGTGVFDGSSNGFKVHYYAWAHGFTSPTWGGYQTACTGGGNGTITTLSPVPANKPTAYPAWWFERDIVPRLNSADANPSWPDSYARPSDFSAINQGQLKNLAVHAYDELHAKLPGGAGTALAALHTTIQANKTGNYDAVNAGQLKNLAKPFYDRLIEVGCATSYPWASYPGNNYAMVNIGQVKNVFSFDLAGPAGQLPAWWQKIYFSGQAGIDPNADPDGDGLTNLQEFQLGSDPNNFFSQGNETVTPSISIASGNNQTAPLGTYATNPLAVYVSDVATGRPLANAQVSFTVTSGGGGLANQPGNATTSSTLVVKTAANGIAQAFFKRGTAAGLAGTISAQAGQSVPVVFNAAAGIGSVSFGLPSYSYTSVDLAAVTCDVVGATIRYTTSGADPTPDDPTVEAGSLVRVSRGQTLKAAAWLEGTRVTPIAASTYAQTDRVIAGWNHSLAIIGGNLWAWGANASGELGIGNKVDQLVPVTVGTLSGVKDASVGESHSLAVDGSGNVWAFGSNQFGQLGDGTTTWETVPTQVSGLGGVVRVAAGGSHSLALKSDGSVWAWGYNVCSELGDGSATDRWSPVAVSGLGAGSQVVAIAAGKFHSMALKSDGTLWAWGANNYGALGDTWGGDYRQVPVKCAISNVVAVAAGEWHTVVLKADGTVWCAGYNVCGQTMNDPSSATTGFVQQAGLSGVVAIGAGVSCSVALKSDGTLVSWGSGSTGQLGNGGNTNSYVPVAASNIGQVVAVSCGDHTLAIRQDGMIYGIGTNANGQLGDGFILNMNIADEVAALSLANRAATLSFTPEGGVYPTTQNVVLSSETPGLQIRYTLDGSEPTESSPMVRVGGSVAVSQSAILRAKGFKYGLVPSQIKGASYQIGIPVTAGSNHSFAILGGTLWAWGANSSGELGIGSTVDQCAPVAVPGIIGVKSVSTGYSHSLAVDGNGNVWAFGDNSWGELGDGTTTQRNVPVQVSGLSDVVAVAAGYYHSLALKNDGSVWAWGYNYYGQLGDGAREFSPIQLPVPVSGLGAGSQVVAIAAGYQFALALKSDGSLWAWGMNNEGQIGIKKEESWVHIVPQRVDTINNVVAVSAGDGHTVALKADGTVWCTGINHNSQTTDSTWNTYGFRQVAGLSGVVAVGAGVQFSEALKSDGTLVTWGFGGSGQLGNGGLASSSIPVPVSNLAHVTTISCGDHSLAAKQDGSIYGFGCNTNGQIGNRENSNQTSPVLVSMKSLDSDRDGLPDWQELLLGANPNKRDSNGDGMSDYVSVMLGINPANPDVDGDGISNIDEILAGTNPFGADPQPTPLVNNPNDKTPPVITITEPTTAILLP